MKSWKSRKLIIFAVAVAVLVVNDLFGSPLDGATVEMLIQLSIGWLVAQGVADVNWQEIKGDANKASDAIADAVDTAKELLEEDDDTPS